METLEKYVDVANIWCLEARQETLVCLRLSETKIGFFFYASLFEKYQVWIPLSEFQQLVLTYLKISSSQLSLTGWGFLKSFEVVVKYLGRPLSARVFMTQFEVYKLYKDEPGKTRFVYIHNTIKHAIFEAGTDSNKDFKSHFLLDIETFRLLEAWGTGLKQGSKKFLCAEIIQKGAEFPEALKTILGIDHFSFADDWHNYDPQQDPTIAERERAAREKAKKKGGQKQKRQATLKGESGSGSPREQPAEGSALLEQLGILIPPTSDFAVVMRVYQCAVKIVEVAKDIPEVELLKKKLRKAEGTNTDLEPTS